MSTFKTNPQQQHNFNTTNNPTTNILGSSSTLDRRKRNPTITILTQSNFDQKNNFDNQSQQQNRSLMMRSMTKLS